MEYLLEQFVEDVNSAIDECGVTVEMQWSLGTKLQRLVREGGDLTTQGTVSQDRKSTRLNSSHW